VFIGLTWIALVHPRGVADTAWIFDLEVFAEHRGRGFGRALLSAAVTHRRAAGGRAAG
jgi:GNAT superfamily N-acetyltransferase